MNMDNRRQRRERRRTLTAEYAEYAETERFPFSRILHCSEKPARAAWQRHGRGCRRGLRILAHIREGYQCDRKSRKPRIPPMNTQNRAPTEGNEGNKGGG